MKKFFQSKGFSFFLHALIVAGGAYASYATGTPLPSVITGGVNALLGSPLDANKQPAPPAQEPKQ